MMKLDIYKAVKTRVPQKRIQKLFGLIVAGEQDPGWKGRVNLILNTDSDIKKLNKEFRSKNKATDVLSFNIDQPLDSHAVFGEIYISAETAERQAVNYGGSLGEEYLRLFCHGMLHLFGYDHIKQKDTRTMQEREKSYLSRI